MCWKCGQEIKDIDVSRDSECQICGADLHSCRNCSFYSPGNRYDCHEYIDELVRDKERANFCDWFRLKRVFSSGTGGMNGESAKEKARKEFDALFSI